MTELHLSLEQITNELFKSIARKQVAVIKWRRERDSNPRDLTVTDLAGLLLTRLGNPGTGKIALPIEHTHDS